MNRRLAILLSVLFCGVALRVPAQLANRIRAVVNDTIITQLQVDMNAAPAPEQLRRQYASTPVLLRQKLAEADEISLRQLIERQLIVHDFKVAGYNLPEPVIEDYIRDRIRQQFGDRTTMIKTLKTEGRSFEQYREDVRERIIIGALETKNVGKAFIVSPLKVENYYEAHQAEFKQEDQVKLRIIVIDNTISPTTSGRRKMADEIRQAVKGGASFIEMASVNSADSWEYPGGERKLMGRSGVMEIFRDAAFSLPLHEVSDVIETPLRCYLIYVDERVPAHVKPLTDPEVRATIERDLQLEERGRLQQKYVDKLKGKTFVRTY
jgi:parvulin-like peptidyl-prolyl isomerase